MPHSPSPLPHGAEPPHARTGRRLGRALLGLVCGVVGVIMLAPFDFAWPTQVRIALWSNAFDLVANVALFVPLGFLHALTRSVDDPAAGVDGARARAARAFVLGALASLAIELTQVLEPLRYPSPFDVGTNALGAYLGAWAHGAVARQLTARSALVGRLALELPLMGLVYLLVPLCTLAALTLGAAPDAETATGAGAAAVARTLGVLALAALAGTLLGQVQRRHLGPAGALGPGAMAAAAGGWFAVSAVPSAAHAPAVLAAGVAVAAGTAWLHGRAAVPFRNDRRFELDALARAAPFLAAYLALLALGDPAAPATRLGTLDVLRRLELLVAFVVLGYVLAEAWGRQELRYRHTAGRVALVALVVGPALELLRLGSLPGMAEAPTLAARVVAAAYGGWLYHLQRAHIRALAAARRAAPAVTLQRAA